MADAQDTTREPTTNEQSALDQERAYLTELAGKPIPARLKG